MNDLIQRLYEFFLRQGYMWRIDGRLQPPTKDQLKLALDRCYADLYAEPTPSQAELGRLLMRRQSGDRFDVYLHIGVYDPNQP